MNQWDMLQDLYRQTLEEMVDPRHPLVVLAGRIPWDELEARVEHPFHIVKNLFGHRKTRYRGIAKNESQWRVLFALANVYMTRKKVIAWGLA